MVHAAFGKDLAVDTGTAPANAVDAVDLADVDGRVESGATADSVSM